MQIDNHEENDQVTELELSNLESPQALTFRLRQTETGEIVCEHDCNAHKPHPHA